MSLSLSTSSGAVRFFLRRMGSKPNKSQTHTMLPISSKCTSDRNHIGNTAVHTRIALVLYRNLLRWCNDMGDIPLTDMLPPVHIQPPQIDSVSLELLAREMERAEIPVDPKYACFFPSNATIKEITGITVHIPTPRDAKQIIRGVYRMNSHASTSNEKERKEQISFAMDWIKNMNGVTERLLEMKLKRKINENRDGVRFRVGQVVKQTKSGWRGVIIGWNCSVADDENGNEKENGNVQQKKDHKSTSLTQKSYQSINSDDKVVYDVALDWGDATLMGSSHPSGLMNVYQSDLTIVEDPYLMRIRSSTDRFLRFDCNSMSFVPRDPLQYEYPNDSVSSWSKYENASNIAAQNVTLGIQKFAKHLMQKVLNRVSESHIERNNLTVLSHHLDKLTNLANCDVIPVKDRFRVQSDQINRKDNGNIQTVLKWQLQKFFELTIEVEDILWTRRRSIEAHRPIRFNLGDYVKHKKYGFRGIVVAWDSEPAYEVTHWDGIQHIENPEQYPFYHVIPDRGDTVTAFGGQRPWRYVCEENLELCLDGGRNLDVDLEPEWQKHGKYIPPDELILRHGDQLNDDGVTEKCLQEIKTAVNSILCLIREGTSDSNDADVNAILDLISTANLLQILKFAEDSATATVLTDSFKEIWKAHNDKDIRYKFDTGVNYLLNGKTDKALNAFGEIVDEDPFFAEAWNKASTCEFMVGNLDASLAAAQKTLEIIPTHYQAMNGLGLVYSEKRDLNHARDIFRKSLELDPWAPVATRLSVCMDTIQKWQKNSVLSNTGRKKTKQNNERTDP